MNLKVNGEDVTHQEGATLLELIRLLHIEDKVMAAAVNMVIVKKDDWSTFYPKEGDKVELLHFVGGG